ncbi:MAG: ATP synthase F0 subunit C [Planctomycetota bacterium]
MSDFVSVLHHLSQAATAAESETANAAGNLGGAICAAIAAIAAAYGIAKLGSAALEGCARQPEAADQLKGTMLLAAALIEGVCLFAVVVGLLDILL